MSNGGFRFLIPAAHPFLQPDHMAVCSVLCHQFVVTSLLYDPSFLQYQNAVSSADRIQPVRYDQHCLIPAELAHGLLNVYFVVGVHTGRGLVKDNDRRVLENAAGNGNALRLS